MPSKYLIGILGAIGTAFIGYCVYFDRKRRNDPCFKEKLRDRRLKAKQAQEASQADDLKSRMPALNDQAALQKFFFDEIQKGEELLATGEYEASVKHLTNAITISGQPQQLLQVFQQTLPPDVFQMLMTSLASATKSTPAASQNMSIDGDSLD